MRRRGFLAALSAAGLADGSMRVPVGAHVWVYAAKLPGYDVTPVLEQIFSDVSAAKLDGVELMYPVLMRDGAPERVAALSKQYNLPVLGSSWNAPMWDSSQTGRIVAEAEFLIPRVAMAGGTRFGVSVGDAKRRKTPAELDTQAGVLKEVFRICGSEGVQPNLHNHIYEVADNEHDLRGTLLRLPYAKLGPDLNWLLRAKVDPVDFIQRHGSSIVYAHLRDEKAAGGWPEALGEGAMDYAGIANALRAAHFEGALAIELAFERDFTPTRPLRESLQMSREYVRTKMRY